MGDLILGLIGVVIGCMLLIAFYVAVYCYRGMVFKKEAIERNKGKEFVAMHLYRERVKAERKRQKQPLQDPVLSIMRLHFDELRRQDSQDRTTHND